MSRMLFFFKPQRPQSMRKARKDLSDYYEDYYSVTGMNWQPFC
jgi:hypothetical protein